MRGIGVGADEGGHSHSQAVGLSITSFAVGATVKETEINWSERTFKRRAINIA